MPANSPATLVIDGLQPSSMYEFQATLAEEGLVFWKLCIFERCGWGWLILSDVLVCSNLLKPHFIYPNLPR